MRSILASLVLLGCPSNVPTPVDPPTVLVDGRDLDGDLAAAPADCDDADATVYPSAFDEAGDGIDQDCDGFDPALPAGPSESLALADGIWRSDVRRGELGFGLAVAAADMDGDQVVDAVLAGAPFHADVSPRREGVGVYTIQEGVASADAARAMVLRGLTPNHSTEGVEISQDGDGDGLPELMLRGHGLDDVSGPLVGWRVPLSGSSAPVDAAVVAASTLRSELLRYAEIGRAGDLDGDGLVETVATQSTAEGVGRVAIWRSPAGPELSIDAPDVLWTAEGLTLAAPHAERDVTGDGTPDLVVLGEGATPRVFVVSEPLAGGSLSASAVATLVLPGGLGSEAYVLVADLNADGVGDVLIGTPYEYFTRGSGRVRVFYGPLSGTLDEPDVQISADRQRDLLGDALAVGDIDGDGQLDLVVGVSQYRTSSGFGLSEGPGHVLVFRGPIQGILGPADAALRLVGEGPADWAGFSVASGFDADGDGMDDLLIGAPGGSSAYWVRGRPL